ncbi:hypothetical protein LWI28_027736 [Acer negundo]|uniref:Uncharacterized protein n=1 Tax=Acer negundo TaxID=4023 RepID=A0AAD5NUA3_ACENE|nr:hypothetical protein LWI28_027736 [Acer negundo]KAK4848191.1 hypothetical protein QYF36_010177 [Acer negundo]
MDQNLVIHDISSDDEPALDEPIVDDYSWLSRLLCDDVEDSDEVVVVREVKSKLSKPAVNKEDDDDDDDCVVLDGDPDKTVEAVDDQASDGDDLLIVGQKGQIACRDYPHPRHDCAIFPFSSTAHKLHCDQCHCYVCDKIAPCSHWGTGVYNNDHCHATDKEAFWKSQRESFKQQKQQKDAPLLVQKVPDTSLSKALPQLYQNSSLDIIRSASNSTTQTPVCRPAVVRPCFPAQRFGVPNIISQGRSRQPGLGYNRSGFQSHSVSQQPQFLSVRNNVIRKDRGHNASNVGMFERAGIAGGALSTNQPVYGSPNHGRGSHAMRSTRNPAPQATSNNVIQIGSVPNMNKDSCTYQNTSETCTASVFVSKVHSQPLVYNQPIPDPQAYSQLIPQQPIYSQPIPEPQIYSQPIPEPLVYGQSIPEPQVYSVPIPESQVYSQPFIQSQVLDQAISQPQVQNQAIPQSQVYTNQIPQSNDGQNVSQLCNQRQGSDFPYLNEWVNISQNNQQQAAENCELNRTGSTNEVELNSECNGSDKFHCNDFEFQNWFPENDSVGVVSEGYITSNLNVGSEETANFEEGMLLFDFETSWNGRSQVSPALF